MKISHLLISSLLLPILVACAPSTSPTPFWHWGDVIPGESTKDDVEALIGPRDPPIPGYKFNQWKYDSFGDIVPFVCESQCDGRLDVFFEDGIVDYLALNFYSDDYPPLSNLLAHFGEPAIVSGMKGADAHSIWYYRELGLTTEEMRELVRIWFYIYPEEGIALTVGPDRQDGIQLLYPCDQGPPDHMPINRLDLRQPVSLESYQSDYPLTTRDFCNP
ncbi:MAG: hypothetical protein DWQ07_11945 [Chloroflexi bacterium]|nr:MAG: hypothetical protein DWQ07_11945 [Chloroflexota bacterium]MBL1196071.1 hypothetical protein [Chloroflexota bacterium]NOH13365.1 hypothetical protein [Chloroflexota bacterium]